MIGRLAGNVIAEDPTGTLVLDVGGVGYELVTPLGTLGRTQRDGELVILHVHTHVREDALELFGFASDAERRTFRLLIGVPNVGPKTALAVLSALPLPELARAVHDANVARLTRVPGIGRKTAERLVLELKEKVSPLETPSPSAETKSSRPRDAERLVGALTNMGYKAGEAERAVSALGSRVGSEPLADLLREALVQLTP
jgi:holliday junction DNA helicase RuvA